MMNSTAGVALADELAIRNLVHDLGRLIDEGTIDDYVSRYVDDAVWEMPANPAVGMAAARFVGADEIRRGAESRRESGLQGPGSNTRHLVSGVVVTPVDAHSALVTSTWMYLADTTTAPRIVSVGTYEDRVVQDGDLWLMTHRRIHVG